MKQIGLADRFFQCKSFFNQRERFSTVESSTVSGNHFVEGKDALGFSCGALRVIQTVLVIAGLNVVIRQPLDGGAGAPTRKTFSRMPMQPPASNRIQLFIEHFANLVVSESK